MKKFRHFPTLILGAFALAFLPLAAMANESQNSAPDKTYRAVFQVSMDGVDQWQGALRNVENTIEYLGPDTKIEVVTHSAGIGLLLAKTAAENAELKAKLEELHEKGVVFAACENTMKRKKVEKSDLIELSTTVGSGVGEIVRKQAQGYAYVKTGG